MKIEIHYTFKSMWIQLYFNVVQPYLQSQSEIQYNFFRKISKRKEATQTNLYNRYSRHARGQKMLFVLFVSFCKDAICLAW